MTAENKATNQSLSDPWWRHGHVWMVIAGPLIVVIASFVTLYLAIRTPDPVYSDAPRSAGAAAHRPADEPGSSALAPAMQARNHAATGVTSVAPSQPSVGSAAPAAQGAERR